LQLLNQAGQHRETLAQISLKIIKSSKKSILSVKK